MRGGERRDVPAVRVDVPNFTTMRWKSIGGLSLSRTSPENQPFQPRERRRKFYGLIEPDNKVIYVGRYFP
jgi:hypothetical protein